MQEDKMRVTTLLCTAQRRLYTTPAAGFVPGTGCNLCVGDSP
jgi:hypothetical protein